MQNPLEPGYGERLRHAFDIHNNLRGVASRFLIGSALASLVLTIAENSEIDTPIGPVATLGAEEPSQKEVVVSGQEHFVPGEIKSITEEGPTARLVFPQRFAKDFRAQPLKGDQTRKLDSFAREINAIYDKLPAARFIVKINGKASDESEKDGNKTSPDLKDKSPNNKPLARDRAGLTQDYLEAKINSPKTTYVLSGREILLNGNQHGRVKKMAKQRKLTETEFIQLYNDQREKLNLSKKEASAMDRWFDANRGANVSSSYTRKFKPKTGPCDQVVRLVKQPDQTITQKNPGKDGWDLHLFPFYLLPLPRLRRRQEKVNPRKKDTPLILRGLEKLADRGESKRLAKRTKSVEFDALSSRRSNLRASRKIAKRDGGRSSRGFIKKDNAEIRSLSRQIHRRKLNKWSKRALGVTAALLIAPFPWFSKKPEKQGNFIATPCKTTDTDYANRYKVWFNSIPLAMYKAAKGQRDWNKQWKVSDKYQPTNDITTTISRPFTRYVVGKDGRVLKTEQFPEKVSIFYKK